VQFGIDFYTEVLDLTYLLESLDENPITRRWEMGKLTKREP
jgi:hypothetical protein